MKLTTEDTEDTEVKADGWAHGGPAFPCVDYTRAADGVGVSIMTITGGMTLRDWFAGQALSGMMANSQGNRQLHEGHWAEYAYTQADAMLVARKEGGK